VEANEMTGAHAAQVDGLRELRGENGAVAARQTAGDEHAIERVVLLDGENL